MRARLVAARSSQDLACSAACDGQRLLETAFRLSRVGDLLAKQQLALDADVLRPRRDARRCAAPSRAPLPAPETRPRIGRSAAVRLGQQREKPRPHRTHAERSTAVHRLTDVRDASMAHRPAGRAAHPRGSRHQSANRVEGRAPTATAIASSAWTPCGLGLATKLRQLGERTGAIIPTLFGLLELTGVRERRSPSPGPPESGIPAPNWRAR